MGCTKSKTVIIVELTIFSVAYHPYGLVTKTICIHIIWHLTSNMFCSVSSSAQTKNEQQSLMCSEGLLFLIPRIYQEKQTP